MLEQRSLLATLVAAYAFNEGAGTNAADASGYNNAGVLSGAAWSAAGKYGHALSFNGAGAVVNVADAPSLDLTTGMTLEAWVRPSAVSSDWRDVIYKGNDIYFLEATSASGGVPAGGAKVGASNLEAYGTSPLPVNAWTHLAVTCDGATLRLYVNGTQVSSAARTGTIQTSANPLQIGGDGIYGQFFAGLIDEVRIYSGPLSAAEIQVDMSTPIGGGGGADLTPPAISAVTPAMGATGVGAASNLTAQFSEAINPTTVNTATFELRDPSGAVVPATVSYSGGVAVLDPAANLASVGAYFTARVRGGPGGVTDLAGNPLAADFTWSFSTGAPVFQRSTVVGTVTQPSAVRFAPDGRIFVAEKSGIIRVFANLSDTAGKVFADLRTNVFNAWDRGLLGLALDPNFATNPFVYVLYTLDASGTQAAPVWGTPGATNDPLPSPPGATANGVVVDGRLSRLPVLAGGTAGAEQVLVERQWPQQFPSHSVGALAFGPDGALYASAGDGASFNYVDYGQTSPQPPGGDARNPPTMGDPVNEGGALRSQDVRSASDPTQLDGAILRVDPATGAPLPDNPLYATGNDANARRIIAYGLRNPFRLAFRPGTSELWVGDVGWDTWEEINRLVSPIDSVVENFGWPAYEGAAQQPGYANANLPLLQSLYAQGAAAHAAPYYAYQHSAAVVPGSGEPTASSSISGLAFSQGGNLPAGYDGALFFADYARGMIYVMYRGVDGLPDPANRKVFWGSSSNPAPAVDLQIGPDGSLYYADFNNNAIRRIGYLAANQPPVAVISAAPSQGPAPLTVNFSSSGSYDPDGNPITLAWDLNGDGVFNDSTAANPSYTYATAGTYTAGLRVTDSLGAATTATRAITVGTPPVAVIDTPAAGLTWKVGDVINFAGHGTDAQDGPLPASAMTWTWTVHHGAHTHPLQTFTGVSGGSLTAPDHEYPAYLELQLTVTDSTGLTHSQSISLYPQTVTLTVATSPSGLQASLGSIEGPSPLSATAIVGSTNTIAVTSPQSQGGTTWAFASWSDGGSIAHTVTAPAVNQTHTATFVAAASGLVAAYNFNAGSGTTLADNSGNGHTGTISGATWTTSGKYGGALSFNGTSARVNIPDAADLRLSTGMTVAAWINPSNLSGWKTVVMKERPGGLAYGLYGGSPRAYANAPAAYVTLAGADSDLGALGPAKLPLNVWSHLAGTYDGATVRLYVNGTLVRSAAAPGSIVSSTNPLRIGGNSVWGNEYFKGRIDDVRIYNRPLSAAEIAADMNTPVTSALALAAQAKPASRQASSASRQVSPEPRQAPPPAAAPLFDEVLRRWQAALGDTLATRNLKNLPVATTGLPRTRPLDALWADLAQGEDPKKESLSQPHAAKGVVKWALQVSNL